jgi:hypothetical protein
MSEFQARKRLFSIKFGNSNEKNKIQEEKIKMIEPINDRSEIVGLNKNKISST